MSVLGFSPEQVVTILQLGISGVAFIFLLMSFVLLKNEQRRKDGPSDKMLKSIRQFSLLSLFFAVIVGGVTLLDKLIPGKSQQITEQCMEAIERAKLLSESAGQTAESLSGLIVSTDNACR